MTHSLSFFLKRLPLHIGRALLGCLLLFGLSAQAGNGFRVPAVPLVTSDPYLSIWSEPHNLHGDVTRHWTHREHALVSLIRVHGKVYRLMGSAPKDAGVLDQTSVSILPTRRRQRSNPWLSDFIL